MKQQLEIPLEGPVQLPRQSRTQQRRQRAKWWFDQMRQVVDGAFAPVPKAPSQQIYFSLEGRR